MKNSGFGIILVVGLIALLLVAACTNTPEAEKEKVVEIGMIAPLTGGAATMAQVILTAEVDYITYFNEEPGIPGVTLKLIWLDTAMDQARIFSGYHRLVERNVVALTTVELASLLNEMAEKDEMPVWAWTPTEESLYPPGWIYTGYATNAEQFAVLADWIMENWKEERPPRIGFVTIEREYGMELLPQSEKYAVSVGMEWLPTELIPYVPLDSTVQLLRLMQQGADFVYVGHMWTTVLPLLRDAHRLGLMDEINFCGWDATLAQPLIQGLGPAADGYFAPKSLPLWNEVHNPGMVWANEVWRKYHGERVMDELYDGCIIWTSILPEAIQRAIEKVGYENLDGHAVKEALDTIEDFDPYGFGPQTTYTNPKDRRGWNRVRICQVQSGDAVPVTDWRETPMLVP